MCGFAGYIDLSRSTSAPGLDHTVARMTATLLHRGPDDGGTWVDAVCGVALGHRRLSILDLSAQGHQPMISACGRYVIVYNGEIYNFRLIQASLSQLGVKLRGHSDTEVLLAAIVEYGVEDAIKRCNGMFAFALWDRKNRSLYLGRDRLGKKPLYFGWGKKSLLFASELKALRVHSGFESQIDRDALTLLLRHNCIPAPYSIYQGIFKLPSASILCLPLDRVEQWHGRHFSALTPWLLQYWSAASIAEQGCRAQFEGSDAEAAELLNDLLRDAVSSRMIADVPLGAFLSGGIDSSLVVALMQEASRQSVRTFSIGFREGGYNEAEDAKAVAAHLGTDHTELYVSPEEAMAVIPRLPYLYDEPFADSSQIPTFLVAQMARQHVTVALSGDGGDELFGGYNRHSWVPSLWQKMRPIPKALRSSVGMVLSSISPSRWDSIFAGLKPLLPGLLRLRTPGDKIQKLVPLLAAGDPEEIYHHLVSHWHDPASIVIGSIEPSTMVSDRSGCPSVAGIAEQMMFLDLITYLPDDILVKVDRASMAVSLEARAPLLDYRLVEFSWRLPLSMKIREGQGKWLLRQILYRYAPKSLIERPKMGFAVPIDAWLRGPLREWSEMLLDETRLKQEGFFHPAPIRQKWREHLSGDRNWQYQLWDVLMFQSWLESTR